MLFPQYSIFEYVWGVLKLTFLCYVILIRDIINTILPCDCASWARRAEVGIRVHIDPGVSQLQARICCLIVSSLGLMPRWLYTIKGKSNLFHS